MAEKVLLKDLLFNKTKVEHIAQEIQRAYPLFNKDEFVCQVVGMFSTLELKARISWIAECLKKYLPGDYRQTVTVILCSLPPPNNPELSDGDFGDFIYAAYAEYIARYGCNKKDLGVSLKALYELTQRFSAEDAIRNFINAFPKETLKVLFQWSQDSHYHVRRLASEGTRPKLPWSQKINIPIREPIPILNNLFFDQKRFVTRSVANHINDISKKDADLAIDTLARWKSLGKQTPKEMDYIIRHALRSLIKNGNTKAMALLGFFSGAQVQALDFKVPKRVKMNTALHFSFALKAKETAHIIVDYILYFQNKSGKLNGRKVFKLKKISLNKGQTLLLTKRHMLLENRTTRKLFRGKHEIEIQLNGQSYGRKSFLVV